MGLLLYFFTFVVEQYLARQRNRQVNSNILGWRLLGYRRVAPDRVLSMGQMELKG